jgi:hypothetical protein
MTSHAWQTNPLARRRRCSAYTQRVHATSPSRNVNPTCLQKRTPRRANLWWRKLMRLDPADIEQIARQVADLVAATQARPSGQFVDAAELAELLGVERDWVYAHANALGAIRLGGPRGRLRFDLRRVQDAWPAPATRTGARRGAGRSRKKRSRATRAGLIPYESDRLGIMSPSSREGTA